MRFSPQSRGRYCQVNFAMWASLILVAVGVVAVSAADLNDIPSYIHICKKKDPNLDACISKSIEALRPQLKEGIPELEVPALEPLLLQEINVSPGRGGPRFKAIGRNVKATGAGDFKINNLKADLDKLTFTVGLEIPKLIFEGEYEVNINFLVVPIKARGPLHGNTTDVTGEAVLHGRLQERDGNQYLKFDTLDLDLNLSDYSIYLGNLFGNDKNLSESVNQAINANSKEFVKVIKPMVEATATEILLKAANRITNHFTFEQLFP